MGKNKSFHLKGQKNAAASKPTYKIEHVIKVGFPPYKEKKVWAVAFVGQRSLGGKLISLAMEWWNVDISPPPS